MTTEASTVRELPDALGDGEEFDARLADHQPAVLLDYDGMLTPIVDRPEDAVMSGHMRETVQALAQRCVVCVVSGRDRPVVRQLMGIDTLVVAGSHGFDIWTPQQGTITHDAVTGFEDLISETTDRLRAEVGSIPGAVVEPKRASVAVHYRLADPERRANITALVNELLEESPGRLKVTPGKMVYELQPKVDWHKGKAVLHLVETLDLDTDDVVPLYLVRTTLPTRMPSGRWLDGASASSWATQMIRRWRTGLPRPTSSCDRLLRWSNFSTCWPADTRKSSGGIGAGLHSRLPGLRPRAGRPA